MVRGHCGARNGCSLHGYVAGLGSKHIKDVMVPPQWTPIFTSFLLCRDGVHLLLPRRHCRLHRRLYHGYNRCDCGLSRMHHRRYALPPSALCHDPWALLMRGTQRSLDVSRESWTAYVTASVVGKLSCGPNATAVPAKSNGFLKHETVYLGAPALDNRGRPSTGSMMERVGLSGGQIMQAAYNVRLDNNR